MTDTPIASRRPLYAAYALGALTLVYTLNFIDRIIISILNEPIRKEFGLGDLQLGLLTGLAFTVFYTLLGVPIARLAERMNRVSLLSASLALWSGMTALCGLAPSYAWLLAARIGVGVGEAGCTPAAQSIIADYYPAERRARALATYALGIPLGSMLAAVGGGWIGGTFGWRAALVLVGLPGILLAIVLKLTVREPPRIGAGPKAPPFSAVLRTLAAQPAFVHTVIGASLASVFGYGALGFLNSFLIRAHGLSQFDASMLNGVVMGIFATIGTFGGGFLADLFGQRRPEAFGFLPAAGFLAAAALHIAAFSAPALALAAPLLMAGTLVHYVYLGPTYATVAQSAEPRMRATAAAILIFVVNLIGLGIGPPLVGAVSDIFANGALAPSGLTPQACKDAADAAPPLCQTASAMGLQRAMAIAAVFDLWAALHFVLAGLALRRRPNTG